MAIFFRFLRVRRAFGVMAALLWAGVLSAGEPVLRVLNFQADHGFQHASKPEAMRLIERLGRDHGWEVVSNTRLNSWRR